MGSVSEELSLVPLHQRPELLEACAELLGEEWGKSRASRLHTLQRSSDAFPTCLLLLRSQGPAEAPATAPATREGPCQLVGHVRLSRVAGRPRDLFVESVVVARALRGQGYGRRLMEATERWAQARGFGCLHLTTHDKQHFYAHLGFVLGEPVQSVAFLSPAIPAEGAGPAGRRQHRMVLALVLWACLALGTAGGESPAPEPLAGDQPFTVVWNVPTGRCQRRFGVGLPLGDYGIVENRDGHFAGQNVTIFYKNKFGLYPYLSQHGVPRNGGIPQRASLSAHLARAAEDIRLLLRPAFHGLAVVDWEEWRPLWAQNWGAKRIYRAASEQWVRDRHGLLSARRRLRLARREFERAARALMEETLLLGRTLRPGGLWGFYRFPDCLNSNWAKEANYTGQCRPAEVQRNNRLGWLWATSAALYPSIYLPPALPPALRRRYVHHRLGEALRVAAFGAGGLLPVVAYSRLSFRRSPRFLEPADLVHTIGESAALGAAGLVLWGDMSYSHSAESCASLRHYLVSTLGPYVANVTAAARECSYGQCHGHGRCVRRQPHDLDSLLHLGPGTSSPASFRCHCYRGWAGEGCAQRVQPSPATSCLAPTPSHSLYGHNDLPPSDTCLPQGKWGW